MNPLPRFYDPLVEIGKRTTVLPHWEQPGATYFVTFRLADSIPQSKLDAWKAERAAWMSLHPRPWTLQVEQEYHRLFSATVDRWLDLGHGDCTLRSPETARVVGDALAFFESQRCVQHAWVIMPNHVHALFTLLNEWTLDQVIHSWKSFTANKINSLMRANEELWQRDYFDRLIRDGQHFVNCARYIRNNPIKAKLREGEYLLYEAEWLKELISPRSDGFQPSS
jgi:hypothetical protein